MLRLTTKVTVSPASSARSSSAAWRRSSIASGRVSAKSAVSSSSVRRSPARPRAIAPGHEVSPDRARLLATRAPPRDEAPVLRLDDVEHALGDPLGVEVARVDAQALGQRHAVLRQALADLVGEGNGCSGESGRRWRSGRRGPSRRPRPARATSRRGWAAPGRRRRHQPPRLGDQALHRLDLDRRRPRGQVAVRRVGGRCASSLAASVAMSAAPRRSSGGEGRSSAG